MISGVETLQKLSKEAESRYRMLFDNASDAIFVLPLGADGMPGKFAEVNEAACKRLGYSKEEFKNLGIKDINKPGGYVAKNLPSLVKTLLANETLLAESVHVAKDGREIPVEIHSRVFSHNGGMHILAVARDITLRKEMEEDLLKAKTEAEAATRLKDRFVSLVAHDLKSPLASIIGFLRLAVKNHGGAMPTDALLALEKAIQTGSRMAGLVDEVLCLGRLKAGTLKLNLKFFDASLIGAKMAADFSPAAKQKGIALKNEIPPNSRVYADKVLLAEAVGNLVANAIKFCRENDEVVIHMEDASTICVKDTGMGIDPATLEKLFEHPGSKVGTAGEMGTGYGLMLVKEVVELGGGTLTVRSETGKGCLFQVRLPDIRPKVLIVDDDAAARFAEREMLKTLDVEVCEAANGQEAWAAVLKVRPHLVISDIHMPEMGGLELLDRIKEDGATQHIPVIIVSARHGMEIRNAVFRAGADDFVLSPWSFDKVVPRLRRFLG